VSVIWPVDSRQLNPSHLVPHPLLSLSAQHALLSLRVPLGNQLLAKVVANVLHNRFALSDDDVLLRVRRPDGNTW